MREAIAELMAKRTKIDEAYVSVRWLTYFYDMDDGYQRYRYRFDQSPWFEKFSITTQYNDDETQTMRHGKSAMMI